MNKIFFITFVAISVLLSFNATAQEKKEQRHFDREAFEARRNAFITAEVGLTPEEAAQFIPLCNELRQKKFEVGRECRKLSKEIRHKENPTDADYNKVIDECLDVEIKEAQLEKEYFERFKKILSPEKVYKYRNAEYKFVRNFMKSGRDNKRKKNRKSKILSLFVLFCLDLVLAFKLREGWRRDVGSPFVLPLSLLYKPLALASFHS